MRLYLTGCSRIIKTTTMESNDPRSLKFMEKWDGSAGKLKRCHLESCELPACRDSWCHYVLRFSFSQFSHQIISQRQVSVHPIKHHRTALIQGSSNSQCQGKPHEEMPPRYDLTYTTWYEAITSPHRRDVGRHRMSVTTNHREVGSQCTIKLPQRRVKCSLIECKCSGVVTLSHRVLYVYV